MADRRVTVGEVEEALSELKRFLATDVSQRIYLTNIYRVRKMQEKAPHWPTNYGDVLRSPTDEAVNLGAGVYLHFDANDTLLYIGKAVSIGTRLGAYFQYDEQRACKIIDIALEESHGVRCVPLDEEIAFLAPAIELFLIQHLSPPVNRQGKVAQ